VQKELCALPKLPAIPTKLELNAPMLLSAGMWIPYPCKVISIIDKCYGRSSRNQVEIRPDKEDQAQVLQMQRGRFSSPQSCSAEPKVPGPEATKPNPAADNSPAVLRVHWIGSTK
jgi:hypothetical protein